MTMDFSSLFRISGLLIIGSALISCNYKEWEPLFNGKNLEGWSVKCLEADSGKEYWTVKDGCITCNSMGDRDHNYVWLATEREFSDFHLKLKFQVFKESDGNSGVQFRSSYDGSEEAPYGGWLNGPQVDIHGPDPYRTGLIYDETDGVRRWIHPSLPDWRITPEQAPKTAKETWLFYFEDDQDAWNSMEIICLGMRVETWVNGNRVTEFNGEGILNDEAHVRKKSGITGCIAFQLHMNDELKIKFKDILIKDLGK
ncbi:MAG: DUF1080 domain-containing protein [Bacteroidales bacterium]|nr:DUF1080 domain-containing protein [Bacteroidales bacterium]